MQPKTTRLADYRPYPYTLEKTELVIRIFDDRTEVDSTLRFSQNEGTGTPPLVLNYKDMTIESLRIDDSDAPYTCEGETLTLACPGKKQFSLRVRNTIDPAANKSCAGFYANEARDLYSTQCEPEDFRRITPYPDRPDVLSVFTVRIEADRTRFPTLLSNGNPVAHGTLDGGRHFALWHDPHPKPCYLFALVAGNLVLAEQSRFTTMEGKTVQLAIHTRTPDAGQCAFAMDSLKRAMAWDERAFGRAYDLDVFNIVAVHDFNMGAMENKGLNIFNTKLVLARPDLTTDAEYINIDRVIGHEYFHNWSGDRVTCRDWFQLSLKEGFTVFRENAYGKDSYNRQVERIGEVRTIKGFQFVEDAGSMAHPVQPKEYIEINNFYTLTVYEKGGEVIGLYKTLLGDETFRKGTDLYFSRHDGHAATIEDFLACMEDVSGRDLKGQFRLWYDQAGTPTVRAASAHDPAGKRFSITLTQEIPHNGKPMLIPVAVGLVGGNGQDLTLENGKTTRVLELTEERQTFTFETVGDALVVPSILRDFSAPVRLETDLGEDQLRFLLVHDSDGVNKWEAGQALMLNAFSRCLGALGAGAPLPAEDALAGAIAGMIDKLKDDNRALLAEMLALPEDGVLIERFKPADPQALQAIKDHLSAVLGRRLRDPLQAVYARCAPEGERFDFDESAVARRALRNAALGLLAAGDFDLGARLAHAQYEHAPTMTERLGALRAVNDRDHPLRAALLDDFYVRFQAYPLVIDRWFALQAAANRPGVIDEVRALCNHPAYSLTNPNRARSLMGAFGTNLAHFHAPDGAGYRLLADFVLRLDPINEQIAARLLTPFKGWRSFDHKLHAPAQAALQSILDAPGQRSAGVFEIVSKALKN